MMFPTHIVTTAATTAYFLNRWGTNNKWLFTFGFLVGALPDFDLLYHIFYRKKKPYGQDAVNHRQTFLHAPLFYLSILTPLFILSLLLQSVVLYQIAVLFSVGVLSHILMDMVFVGGVPLLWPFDKRLFGIFVTVSRKKLQKHIERGGDWFGFYTHHPLFYFEIVFLGTMFITELVKPSLVLGSIVFFAIPALALKYKQRKREMVERISEVVHN